MGGAATSIGRDVLTDVSLADTILNNLGIIAAVTAALYTLAAI